MSNSSHSDPKRELLRHALATLAYRGSKAIRNSSEEFALFQASGGVRTPGEILAHVGDLMDWALSMAQGKQEWHNSRPQDWKKETARFFSAVKQFDDFLASSEALQAPTEKLLQGPIADALAHMGQIAMLRRMAGNPVKGENFYAAEITAGRVGEDQAKPKFEF
jgi:hypothetical protein